MIPIESSNDSSIFPVLTQDGSDGLYHVTTTITIDLVLGTNNEIDRYRDLINGCSPIARPTQTTITEAPVIARLVRDQFVSTSGNFPAGLRCGPAIVAGVSFAGVIHMYWVSVIPIVRASIIKTNVTLGQFALTCGAISYRCN
jgi:hypothetical protein